MSGGIESPGEYLKRLGASGEGPHDIGTAALMLAALDHPTAKLEPFRAHLAELAEAARGELEFSRNAENAARGLGDILVGHYGYDGDHARYEDPGNADLMSVIERRRGLPVALGILYIHAARAAGLEAHGLSAPGHFLLALSVKGSEALIDPFNGGAAVEREHLSAPPLLLEPSHADDPGPLSPVSDTDVLLRLQNNIKTRALQARNMNRALEVLLHMLLIAPDRSHLWLELARLQESAGALGAARMAYERGIATGSQSGSLGNEAALALHALKRRLN